MGRARPPIAGFCADLTIPGEIVNFANFHTSETPEIRLFQFSSIVSRHGPCGIATELSKTCKIRIFFWSVQFLIQLGHEAQPCDAKTSGSCAGRFPMEGEHTKPSRATSPLARRESPFVRRESPFVQREARCYTDAGEAGVWSERQAPGSPREWKRCCQPRAAKPRNPRHLPSIGGRSGSGSSISGVDDTCSPHQIRSSRFQCKPGIVTTHAAATERTATACCPSFRSRDRKDGHRVRSDQ